MKESFKDIATSINMINLEKALVLERNLKLLSESKSSSQISEVLEKMQEMIGLLQNKSGGGSTQTIIEKQVPTQNTVRDNSFDAAVKELLTDIGEKLGLVNSRLGGKLKVSVVGANSNTI